MMASSRRWMTAGGTCGLLLAVLLGCQRREVVPPLPFAVQVATLQREPITTETRFSATVRERQRIELSFKVPGTVASLLQVPGADGRMRDVHEGDTVISDPQRPLARLDDSDYRRKRAVAEERVAQAQAKQRAATAAATAIRANYARIKSLREHGSVAQQTYDDTLARKDAAEADLEAAKREVSAATVAFQQADDDWKKCSLEVPIPKAVVSRKFIEGNERVPGGQPVFEIMDLSRVRVAFGIPDTKIKSFQLGQTVSVTADAIPGERFTGRVTKMLPAADLRTRTFEVEVTIDEPKGLKPGMVVTIIVGRREEVTLVPMTAVQRGSTSAEFAVYLVVDEDGQKIARRRRVQLDGVYDNRIRLVEGAGSEVGVGDVIVVTGAFRLTDGQAVRVLESQEPTLVGRI